MQAQQDQTERPEEQPKQKTDDFVHLQRLENQVNQVFVDYMPIWGSALQQTQRQLRGPSVQGIQSHFRRQWAFAGSTFFSVSHWRLSRMKRFPGLELWDMLQQ